MGSSSPNFGVKMPRISELPPRSCRCPPSYTSPSPSPNEDHPSEVTGDVAPRNARPTAIFRIFVRWERPLETSTDSLGLPPSWVAFFSNPDPFWLHMLFWRNQEYHSKMCWWYDDISESSSGFFGGLLRKFAQTCAASHNSPECVPQKTSLNYIDWKTKHVQLYSTPFLVWCLRTLHPKCKSIVWKLNSLHHGTTE